MADRPTSIITDLQPDDPLEQDANYRYGASDRQFIDTQILGCQLHLATNVLNGVIATWGDLDTNGDDVVEGDVVCLAGSTLGSLTLALPTPLGNAGKAAGVVMRAATAGAKVLYAVFGTLKPSITGLGATSGFARVSSAGRLERVAALGTGDFGVGAIDAAGNLSIGADVETGSIGAVGVTAPITNTGTASAPVIAISAASGAAAGSMSAAHWTKLEGIAASAAALGSGTPEKVSNSAGSAGAALTAAPFNHTHQIDPASGAAAGSMSTAHWTKLEGIAASAAAVGSATPAKVVNSAGSAGASASASRQDHTHQIDPASGAAAGSMSVAHFNKLAALPPVNYHDLVFFAGLRETSSSSPATTGARTVNASVDFPWAVSATLIAGLVVNTTGPVHADLAVTPGFAVLAVADQVSTTYAEIEVDVTADVIGAASATLAVRVYADVGSGAITYAAIRFA